MANASAALRITNPQTVDEYRAMLAEAGVPAPWTQPDAAGDVYAADGTHILTIDPDRSRLDELVVTQADLLILAVNTCAGFKAVAHA